MKLKTKLLEYFLLASFSVLAQKAIELKSPNGTIKVSVNLSDQIYYSVSYNGDELLNKNHLSLSLRNEVLGSGPKLISAKNTAMVTVIKPYIPLKFSTITSKYNKLLLSFKGVYAVEFRA